MKCLKLKSELFFKLHFDIDRYYNRAYSCLNKGLAKRYFNFNGRIEA